MHALFLLNGAFTRLNSGMDDRLLIRESIFGLTDGRNEIAR